MKRILVVDDDMMNLVLVKHTLSENYNVLSASSGEEALRSLEKELPDIVLLDVEMPGMDGREVARVMKADKRFAGIPIVFLTADSDPQTEAECLNLGADDFIIKPFVPMVMQRRISRILELKDLKNALEAQLEQKVKQIEDVTRLSITDALTGLYNRSYLERRVMELIDEGLKGTLFMMDIDNFKKVNDTFGHIAGDKTLKIFADTLRENTRKMDIVGRLGGDEFVIYFADMTDSKVSEKKAGSIIEMFLEKFRTLYCLPEVSVSIGIVHCPENGKDFKTLYKNADKALYYTKNNGKNFYHFFDEKREDTSETYDTAVDFNNVRNLIEGKLDTSKGAFQVAYGEFQKIYDFILRCVARRQQLVQTVLFTLSLKGEDTFEIEDMENAMNVLQQAVKSSLRAVDVGTGYSSRQYILILMDADMENGTKVVERVVYKFYELYGKDNMVLSYDIQTMHPEMKQGDQ
ncbi:MAG: diguanylate cyclase [Suilimivivens sp.]